MSQTVESAPSGAALTLFSGGQDSTVCLALALSRFQRVETIGFDYGQRHAVELAQRARIREKISALFPDWGARLGEDHRLAIPTLNEISETALTRDAEIVLSADGLPNTFVPGRNILFLTFAAALGYRRHIGTLVGGMCETDYSGYPDCREATIKATQQALALGLDRPIEILTPLMHIDKAATWRLAEQIGGEALVALIVEESHTCYLGDRSKRFAWGHGCGECPACKLRAAGWERYRAGR
ncbi:MAG TPA: 7-cyano-7-deazaguanine synthase QueC [Methylocystis sp.]|nr:7-cyano-7-deazaguanine synthase QueC [Methylocystis sp.]